MTGYANPRIYRMGEDDPPPPDVQRQRAAQAKHDAWHKHGLLMTDPNDLLSDFDRQFLINIAEKLYGKRSL